jgi:hypothetical protein
MVRLLIPDRADRAGLGVAEYARAFVNGLDPKLLQRLAVELREALSPVYEGTGKRLRAEKVLHEFRMLFAELFSGSDAAGRPGVQAIVDGLSVESLNLLLLPEPAPWKLARVSVFWLGRLAVRMLPDAASLHSVVADFGGEQLPSPRMTVLRLLADNQAHGGRALAEYLKPHSLNERDLKLASDRMLALLSPNSFLGKGSTGLHHASLDEETLAAAIVKKHFLSEFGSIDPARVAAAGEAMELVIVNVGSLRALSKPMTQSLAWAFSGVMTNPPINKQLINCVSRSKGAGSLWEASNAGFYPGNDDLFAFLGCLARDSSSIRIVAGSIRPMISSTAARVKGLPALETLAEGAGYILGAMQAQVDRDNSSNRDLVEGLAMSATVLSATAGGLVGGPLGASSAGFLGSGVIDFIASKLDTDRFPSSIPFGSKEVEDYLKQVYVLSAFEWLDEPTKDRITKELSKQASAFGPDKLNAAVLVSYGSLGPNGERRVTLSLPGLDKLSDKDFRAVLRVMSDAATSGDEGATQKVVKRFGFVGQYNASMTRERKK